MAIHKGPCIAFSYIVWVRRRYNFKTIILSDTHSSGPSASKFYILNLIAYWQISYTVTSSKVVQKKVWPMLYYCIHSSEVWSVSVVLISELSHLSQAKHYWGKTLWSLKCKFPWALRTVVFILVSGGFGFQGVFYYFFKSIFTKYLFDMWTFYFRCSVRHPHSEVMHVSIMNIFESYGGEFVL